MNRMASGTALLEQQNQAGARAAECATLRAPLRQAVPAARAGDWLSGRAPRSHRGGHWFDPSIAHQVSGYADLHQAHLKVSPSRWMAAGCPGPSKVKTWYPRSCPPVAPKKWSSSAARSNPLRITSARGPAGEALDRVGDTVLRPLGDGTVKAGQHRGELL